MGFGNDLDEKRALRKELREHKGKVAEKPEVMAGAKEMTEADQAMVEARNAHPDIKPLADKFSEIQGEFIKARVDGDAELAKKYQSEYANSPMDLEAAARKNEDLKPFYEEPEAKSKAFEDAEKKALMEIPEAKELLDKLDS